MNMTASALSAIRAKTKLGKSEIRELTADELDFVSGGKGAATSSVLFRSCSGKHFDNVTIVA